MIETVALRVANVSDADAIADIISAGVAPGVRQAMIYGCSGVHRFLRCELELATELSERLFLVGEHEGRITGAMELRWTAGELFLNQIAVAASARGQGLGAAMLRAAVQMVGSRRWERMLLDVFEDNVMASRWYERLGFEELSRADWWTLPLDRLPAPIEFAVLNYAQASVAHDAFGFSQLEISTRRGRHAVGLLGDAYFRVSTLEAVNDADLLSGLHMLAPERALLALLPSDTMPPDRAAGARLLCRTRRMACPLPLLLERLG